MSSATGTVADIMSGIQGTADLYAGAAEHSKALRVNGPVRRAVGDLGMLGGNADEAAKAAARARVATAQRHPLEMARRVARSSGARMVGRAGGVVSGAMAANDMAQNGANLVNSLDLAAAGAAFTPNPLTAVAGNAWNLGRGAGELLPERAKEVIAGTLNGVARRFGGGVDDGALIADIADKRVAAENAARRRDK